MDRENLAKRIVKGIEECESMNGTHVYIDKTDAIQLVKILMDEKAEPMLSRIRPGRKLFYCSDCGRSFRSEGREDEESLQKWGYHAWIAKCPGCGREVRQTDRYWR